jgi:hypothetical protein
MDGWRRKGGMRGVEGTERVRGWNQWRGECSTGS